MERPGGYSPINSLARSSIREPQFMKKIAIVTPCFNEAKRLDKEEFTRMVSNNRWISFIFVNDGSDDNTKEMLAGLALANPERMRLINLEKNVGKAEAVRRGMLEACKGDHDLVGFWDADLSTPLEAIDDMARLFEREKTKIVIGSRVKLMGRKIERRIFRHYLGRVFATVASMALNLPVYDTQCGAKLFENNETLKIIFSEPFMVDWIFDVEMLARLELYELENNSGSLDEALIEHPLDRWKDIRGSKVNLSHFIKAPWDMAKIIAKYSPRIYKLKKGR
ncbi:Putative glycosyltransferase [hydrothermal vent metagenome]|uniref:Glycosyltransferase n=1 Tax=hydrothermal vent metagenome TaxID=652676 RepID=A0A3B1CGI6_9ZZZZ